MITVLNIWMLSGRQYFNMVDYTWIKSNSVQVNFFEPETEDVVAYGNARYRIVRKEAGYEIVTKSEKQEMALKLKYGKDLLLVDSQTIQSY